jgi:hypothetical protein
VTILCGIVPFDATEAKDSSIAFFVNSSIQKAPP